MNLHDAPPGTIRTFSGRFVDPFNPNPDDLLIEDIAHALANINRWNGHTAHPYSVAEHSIAVALRLPPELRLAGLLHDAPEAYIGDIPTPIKGRMFAKVDFGEPENAEIWEIQHSEKLITRLVLEKFTSYELYPFAGLNQVHEADRAQLLHEWETLVLKREKPQRYPFGAKIAFLHYFDRFGGKRI